MSDILSAVLPKNTEIRKELLSALKRRFGDRLVVLKGTAFAVPKVSDDLAPADVSSLKVWERSGFYSALIKHFEGTESEKRLSRAIVENPTTLTRGKTEYLSLRESFRRERLLSRFRPRGTRTFFEP